MSCDSFDCEPFDFYCETTPRARKEHKCGACGEKIVPGQKYDRLVSKFEGKMYTDIRCPRCTKIYEHLRERMERNGDPGEFPAYLLDCGDDYRDRWEEDPPPEIAALAFALPGEIT